MRNRLRMMSYIIVCAIAYNVSASGVIWNDLTFYDWGAQQIGGQTYHYCAWETPYFMFHSVLEDSVLYLCADYGNFPEYTYAVTLAQAGDVVCLTVFIFYLLAPPCISKPMLLSNPEMVSKSYDFFF